MNEAEVTALVSDVQLYADRHKGQIYAPIDHPAFAHFRTHHGPERFEPIEQNLSPDARTALDIGTHWGYFAHMLEKAGLEVTAAESLPEYQRYLYQIRALYGDKFTIFKGNVFDLPHVNFDVVLALNIFHHFIKTKAVHEKFIEFLQRIDCKQMFFQSHDTREGQMAGAYHNYAPEEFCEFLLKNVRGLSRYEKIASFKSRPMFLLA